jgi:hypothetical protein
MMGNRQQPMNESTPVTTLLDARPATLEDVIEYLQFELASFEHDPADSDYQHGYEQAIHDMRTDFLRWRPASHDCSTCASNGQLEFLGAPPTRWLH